MFSRASNLNLEVVAQDLGDIQAAPERALGLLAVSLREHECMSERRLELELPRAAATCVVEHCERTACPKAALVQQVELHKQSGAGAGQRHAQFSAVIVRVSPG
jgi:hypothetical protein